MALTYGFLNSKDLFQKLKRDANALEKECTSDNFFNFVVTAYHLCDWIKKDPSCPQSSKNDVSYVRQRTCIRVCRDIANASKHFRLNYTPIVAKTESKRGYGHGRYEHGGYNKGEEKIYIELADGTKCDALSLYREVIDFWERFFKEHNI